MTMTEDEARKKRCCGPDDCGRWKFGEPKALRYEDQAGGRNCIASECMAWRQDPSAFKWQKLSWYSPDAASEMERKFLANGYQTDDGENFTKNTGHGYCGLAGKEN